MYECPRPNGERFDVATSRGVPNTTGAAPEADKLDSRRDPHFEACSRVLAAVAVDSSISLSRTGAFFPPRPIKKII